jgi:hypothetical protein
MHALLLATREGTQPLVGVVVCSCGAKSFLSCLGHPVPAYAEGFEHVVHIVTYKPTPSPTRILRKIAHFPSILAGVPAATYGRPVEDEFAR